MGRVFGIRDEAGRGIIFTLRPLNSSGLVRLEVQATTISLQGRITYRSIFIIYISISTYPYWATASFTDDSPSGLWVPLPDEAFPPPQALRLGHIRPRREALTYKRRRAWFVSESHEDGNPRLWLKCHGGEHPGKCSRGSVELFGEQNVRCWRNSQMCRTNSIFCSFTKRRISGKKIFLIIIWEMQNVKKTQARTEII